MFDHEIDALARESLEREFAWSAIFGRIDLAAIEARIDIHLMAEDARDAIDRQLGYSEAFINRARAQRSRHARERAQRGVKA